MVPADEHSVQLPSADQLLRAVRIYLELAYDGDRPPEVVRQRVPGPDVDVQQYLMGDAVERTPPEAPLHEVRAFAIRLGNHQYPNMKLRLSRPPNEPVLLLSVDAHDAMLQAPPDSPDYEALEALKACNADLARRIGKAWEQDDLPTEKAHLRRALDRARGRSDPTAK